MIGRLFLLLAVLFVLVVPVFALAQTVDDARGLIAQGKLEQARTVLDGILEANPENRRARFYQADLLARTGRMQEAFDLYHQLIQQNPADAISQSIQRLFRERGDSPKSARRIEELFGQVQQAAKKGDVANVAAALSEVVNLAPDHMAALNGLAQALERLKRYPQAIRHLVHIVKLNPRNTSAQFRLAALYERVGDLDGARGAYQTVLKKQPKNIKALLGLGRMALSHDRNFGTSAEYFAKVLELDPGHAQATYLLGFSQLQAGNEQAAMATFKKAVELDDSLYTAHHQLGLLYEKLGRTGDSLAAFSKVAEFGGNSPEARQAKRRLALYGGSGEVAAQVKDLIAEGLAAIDADDVERAKFLFQSVIDLVPTNTLAHYNLGVLHAREGNTDAATLSLKAAVEGDPTHYLSHYVLAIIYVGSGLFEEAYESFKQVARWAPKNSPHRADATLKVESVGSVLAEYEGKQEAQEQFREGLSRVKEKDVEGALAHFERAIELDGENPFFHYNAGILYVERSAFDKAYKAFSRAIELKPDHVQSHFRLALFYEITGFPQDAARSFQDVVRYGTTEPEVDEAKSRLTGVLEKAEVKEKSLAYLLAANALEANEDTERALFAIRISIRLKPENTAVQTRYAELLMKSGVGDDALEFLLQKLEEDPENSRFLFNVAQIYRNQGDLEKSLEYMRRAAKQNPNNLTVARLHAITLDELGRKAEAVEALKVYVDAHPNMERGVLFLNNLLLRQGKNAEAANLLDWYLAANGETTEVLFERGRVSALMGDQPALPEEPGEGGVSELIDTGAEVGEPLYATAVEWFERAIAIAGDSPADKRFAARARAQITRSKRLHLNLTQQVLNFNTNANNSSTNPKAGASSKVTFSGSYILVRHPRFSLPITFSTDHQLHYTFQTYVNNNTVGASLPVRLSVFTLVPSLSSTFVRTQDGKSSVRYTGGFSASVQVKIPSTLTVSYSQTEFSSFTNALNNYKQGVLNLNTGHAWGMGKLGRMRGNIRYSQDIRDAVAAIRDTDRTNLTLSTSLSRSLKRQQSLSGTASVTLSEDIRGSNIRPGSATGEVVPIETQVINLSASFGFKPYPKVNGTLSASYSYNEFLSGTFQTFTVDVLDPDTGDMVPTQVTEEARQVQTSLSFNLSFVYRPSDNTKWTVRLGQAESRASIDTPASIEDVLTNQVVQDNINKQQTVTITMSYSF